MKSGDIVWVISYQHCDECPEGCIGCERKWLRDLGWKEEELPTQSLSLF